MKTLADELVKLKAALNTPMGLTALESLTLHRIEALTDVAILADDVDRPCSSHSEHQDGCSDCEMNAAIAALRRAFGCEE